MRRPHCLEVLFVVCISLSLAPYDQAQQNRRTFRISVEVEADDVIKSEVISKINSGLRSLGDIVLVTDDPKLRVSIVAIKDPSVAGHELGYTLSVVVTKAFQKIDLAVVKAWAKGEAGEQLLIDYFGEGVTLVHHSVVSGSAIEDVCKRAVASIDVGPIEAERKFWQDIDDNTRRYVELHKKYPNKSVMEIQEMIDKEKAKEP